VSACLSETNWRQDKMRPKIWRFISREGD